MLKSAIQSQEVDKQAKEVAESSRAKREQLETQWIQALQSANFLSESFLQSQATPAEQETWKNAIADSKRQNVQLSTLFQEISGSIGDRTTDEELLEQRRIQTLAEQLPTQVKVHKSPEGARLIVETF